MSTSSQDSSSASTSTSTSSNSNTNNNSNSERRNIISIIEPLSYSTSLCGYCKKPDGQKLKGSKSYGCWAHILSCDTYKTLIDMGWRRSGAYLYKPDMASTCCCQYTISLQTQEFKVSKSQKALLKKFNSFVINGGREGQVGWGRSESDVEPSFDNAEEVLVEGKQAASKMKGNHDSQLTNAVAVTYNPKNNVGTNLAAVDDNEEFLPSTSTGNKRMKINSTRSVQVPSINSISISESSTVEPGRKGKGKDKQQQHKKKQPETLLELLKEAEWSNSNPDEPFKHRFEYKLEPASFTQEKYDLFHEYQTQIHNEEAKKVTPKGFKRFLIDTPLEPESSNFSNGFGSFHALYYLDGELIAFAVLDLLPGVISSVYFVWSPKWSGMSLGKISALREIGMGLESGEQGERYMMGFYIHKNQKMKYKADYQPSFLLDPETNEYFPWNFCKPILDLNDHCTSFSNPSPPRELPSPLSSNPASITFELKSKESNTEESEGSEEDEDEDEDEISRWPTLSPPGCLDPSDLPKDLILSSYILEGRTLVPLVFSKSWNNQPAKNVKIRECLAALGDRTKGKIGLWVG